MALRGRAVILAAMSASISFPGTEAGWVYSTGRFEVILAAALGYYADPGKVPGMLGYMSFICNDVFHAAWPDRFPQVDGGGLKHLEVGDHPLAEQRELLRALRLAAEGFRSGTAPQEVGYAWENRFSIGNSADEIADLLERSLRQGGHPSE